MPFDKKFFSPVHQKKFFPAGLFALKIKTMFRVLTAEFWVKRMNVRNEAPYKFSGFCLMNFCLKNI